jgi:hypothetical protein
MSELTVTPYHAAKLVTEMLKEDGFDKTIPPQRMYGEVKAGRLTNVAAEGEKIRIELVELANWYRNYIENDALVAAAFDKDELKAALRSMM